MKTHRTHRRLVVGAACTLLVLGLAVAAMILGRSTVMSDDLARLLDRPQIASEASVPAPSEVDQASVRAVTATPRGDSIYAGRPVSDAHGICVIIMPRGDRSLTAGSCSTGWSASAHADDMSARLNRHARQIGISPEDEWSEFVDVDYDDELAP